MSRAGIRSIATDCRAASAIRVSLLAVALLSGVIGPTSYAWGDKGSGSGSSGSSGSGSSGGSGSGSSGSGSSGSGSNSGSSGGSDNSGSGSSNSGSGSGGSQGSSSSGSGSENSRANSSDSESHATPSLSAGQERVYQGGWTERIRNGRYEIFDPQGRSVINRKAIPADALRIDKSSSR
ncbi:hypothetical protein SAMN05428967_4072 [Phyllobacterium sp. YR620]|nr:hypothetical protein SAMN05428967_4072 [Phyllobacterium sp. YR620]